MGKFLSFNGVIFGKQNNGVAESPLKARNVFENPFLKYEVLC